MVRAKTREGELATVLVEGVFNPLPRGARDLLPATCRFRRRVTNELLDGFERWGYEPVMPPAVEYAEVLDRGLSGEERARTVRFVEAGSGDVVSLRSDVTPQIARMVAQRIGGTLPEDGIVRLCYAADVIRVPDGRRDRTEFHQVGVEYVGDEEPSADAELIALCHEGLSALGLVHHRFDLSHNALVRGALKGLGLPAGALLELRDRLARKDASGLDDALRRWKVAPRRRRAFVALSELSGPPSLMGRARDELAALRVGDALDRVDALLDTLRRDAPAAHDRVVLDLGEVRGLDYYTGLRMRVWAPGVSAPIVCGGRYDDLLVRYGADLPATGFAVDLDALETALAAADVAVEGADPRSARLVVFDLADGDGEHAAALRHAAMGEARRARARGGRAWVDGRMPVEHACARAEAAGVERISMFSWSDAGPRRQRWRKMARGWKQER